MTRRDFLFSTDRFNLSKVKEHFINPCCFGEDLASWLHERLQIVGLTVDEPGQEDFGWYLGARLGADRYLLTISGNPDEENQTTNRGEWRISVEKHRSFWERITGKNLLVPTDPVLTAVEGLLRATSDFQNLRTE